MLRYVVIGAVAAVCLPRAFSLLADPPAERDVLPPPRKVVPVEPIPAAPVMPPVYNHNPYDAWVSYGVGRQGFWRPRVVYSPYGPYYVYSGQPFPWAPTRQGEFRPYIVAPPEGYGPPSGPILYGPPPISGRIPPRN